MSLREYASLDRNRMGPLLLLDASDEQFTTSQACDANRTILGTLPALSGDYAYELYFWSTSRSDLSGLLSFGVATADVDLETQLGTDAGGAGYGYAAADGLVLNTGGTLETTEPQGERISLGCHLSLSPGDATCEFLVDGNVISTIDLPTGLAWYPAFSLGGGAAAGDISALVNFGKWRFDRLPWRNGWSQQSAGLATITLALLAEAFRSTAADTPANTPYGPHVCNPGELFFSDAVRPWHLRDGSSYKPSQQSTLVLDNRGNKFAALLAADVKGSTVVLQVIDAPAGAVGTLASAETMMTAIIDDVQRTKKGQIELTLRGMLSRFDRPMKMRRIAPFYEPTSAGKVVPFGRGAERNIQPVLLDKPLRLYLLGDRAYTNLTLVSDEGAPLDPNAVPPQWSTALDHEGLKLETEAVGRVAVDGSTVGPQYDIPGAEDVLEDVGTFESWPGPSGITTTPPDGWTFSGNVGSQMIKYAVGSDTVARVKTTRPWYPAGSKFGDYLELDTAPLIPGRSYRLTYRLVAAVSSEPLQGGPGRRGGLMLRTALNDDPLDAITTHAVAIQSPSGPATNRAIDFTVPPGGSPRSLFIIATASSGSSAGSATGIGYIDMSDIRVELLGQFVSLPLESVSPTDLFTDILVEIEGEDPSVFSSDDLDAIFAAAGYGIGIRKEDTPNISEMLVEILDQYGAVPFEDEFGVIRARTFLMPEDPGDIVATFSRANVDLKSVRIFPITAPGLTTQFEYRQNCTPFADGDLVSDTDLVTPAMRAAYKGRGQFQFSASVQPAQEYAKRIGAARRLLLVDDGVAARSAAERVVAQMTVKRMACEFTATFQGMKLGLGPTVKPQQLYPVDKILVDLPELGLPATTMRVLERAPRVLGGLITIMGIY